MSIRNVWQLPVYHSLILGLLKNLLRLFFSKYDASRQPTYVIPHIQRRIIKARAAELKLPSEFGRPVRCASLDLLTSP